MNCLCNWNSAESGVTWKNLEFAQAVPYLSEWREAVTPFLCWGFLTVLIHFACLSLLSIDLTIFLSLTSSKCVFNVNKQCCSVDLKCGKCWLSGAGVAVDYLTCKEDGMFWLILSSGLMELLFAAAATLVLPYGVTCRRCRCFFFPMVDRKPHQCCAMLCIAV